MSQFHLINTLAGVVVPQLIAPVTVIIYKQFFNSVPKDFREAAVIDGASEWQLLFRIYLPMNWGITTALAIITFIARLEPVSVAVPRRQLRRQDEHHGRDHPGP